MNKWPRQRVLEALREMSDADGYAPPQASVPHGLRSAAERKWGSWRNACTEAGVKVRPRGRPRKTAA